MNVGETLVAQFGSSADSSAFVAKDLDETLNLDGEGNVKTSWVDGDEVWFWVQHDASLVIDRVEPTSGMVVDCGQARRSRTQELTFKTADTVELSHIPAKNPTYTWYGNKGAGLTRNGRAVSVSGNLPCTCDAEIPIDVHLYRFIPPKLDLGSGETYRVVIVIYLEAA